MPLARAVEFLLYHIEKERFVTERISDGSGPLYLVARYRASFVGDYDMRWVERLIPSLLILWRSVLGCRFRIFAAPFGPSITPPVCFSTAIMCPRSTSVRVERAGGADLEYRATSASESPSGACWRTPRAEIGARSGFSSRIGCWHRIAARSMTFCSSRTFPGQE